VRYTGRLAIVAATSVALGLVSNPAWAHSRLLHTDPADGGTVRQSTTAVTLTFNEMVKQRFTTVVVQGPDGQSYSRGGVRVVDENVTQDVYPLPSGDFHVAWRVISADGHPVQGEFRFSVVLPRGAEPTEHPVRATPVPGKRSGSWVWLLAGAVVVLVTVAWVAVVGRRRRARVHA
jgi:methionine-rich copper-binding protein CopC